jgi:hypothetical protein
VSSTILAMITAGALLVTVVLPAEYGIDPTGVGEKLGLKQMGQIKMQLAQEANEDAENVAALEASQSIEEGASVEPQPVQMVAPKATPKDDEQAQLDVLIEKATEPQEFSAPETEVAARVQNEPSAEANISENETNNSERKDERSFTLQPGEGAEIKADLPTNGKLAYFWTANGGQVNYDFHGEPHSNPRDSTLYRKERGVGQDEGVFEAPNDGIHGWFWRNRMDRPVTVTLITSGDYREIKRLK